MARVPDTSLFEDAVDVPMWLEADRATPFAERLRRDRGVAHRIHAHDPVARVRGWWREIADGNERAGAKLDRLRQGVAAAMAVVGAAAGMAVAAAAFQYDGTHPVNVVTLLALLVAVPTLLLILTLLLAIPGRVPGLRGLQDLIASVSPGALAAAIYRRLAKPPPDLARLFGWQPARGGAASRFAKWQLLYWSQIAAVAFNLAALAYGAVDIAFTDLAFGWSTTLDVDPLTVSRIVEAMALPWRGIAPAAVPDLDLIEASQFYRLEGSGAFDAAAPRALAGWWSFTILAIVTYGLVPRLALLVFAAVRLSAATRALLLEDPRVTALLDRMATPEVETAALEPDDAAVDDSPVPPRAHARLAGPAAAVIWSGAMRPEAAPDYARSRLGLELTEVADAGGGRELDDDRRAVERLAARNVTTLVVFTPAWEPPLLEFLDFLARLRERLGGSASIVVTPVPERRQHVSAVERDTWARAVARLADPHVYLETGAA